MINMRYSLPAFILVLFLYSSCSGNKEQEPAKDTIDKAFLNKVKTVKATLSDQEEELTLNGKVEYDDNKVISYVPLVSGIVERTNFQLGDKVQKGQTMLEIRSSDLTSLQTDHITAETELRVAERELQTAQSMYDDKMLSQSELLEAQGKVKQAQAAFDKARNDMHSYGADKTTGTFTIKSPMTGYVVEKRVSPGSPISADGDPIFIVADLNNVWITANVYASNIQFVQEGMDVDITTLSYPGEVFTGKISNLSQVFDPEEKVLKARIVMPNQNLKFKPEMSVLIKLKSKTKNKLITIPSKALIFDDNKNYVIVEESPNKFVIREVELRGHLNDISYIGSGLSDGETVVCKNQLLIFSELKGY